MNKKVIISMLPVILTVIAAFLIIGLFGNRVITVMSESTPKEGRHCIIIDPGHGGEDGGATSCAGILESEYNLEISLKLNDLLRFLGYDTAMIRTIDISVYTEGKTIAQKKVSDLKERVKTVNETENAVLLSIHQNYFSDCKYSGAQVFYANTQDSEPLAKQLQQSFAETVNPGSSRAAKQAQGIYLMEHIRCTGVLIECGFLSNTEEEAKLRSDSYQKQLCCVIAACVSRFLDT